MPRTTKLRLSKDGHVIGDLDVTAHPISEQQKIKVTDLFFFILATFAVIFGIIIIISAL